MPETKIIYIIFISIAIGTVTIDTKEKYFIFVYPAGIFYFYLDTYNNYQQTDEI